jgi:hypothetical protein
LRVASETSPRLRKTRLTVISDTPEASETSRRVSGRFVGVLKLDFLFIRAEWYRDQCAQYKPTEADDKQVGFL